MTTLAFYHGYTTFIELPNNVFWYFLHLNCLVVKVSLKKNSFYILVHRWVSNHILTSIVLINMIGIGLLLDLQVVEHLLFICFIRCTSSHYFTLPYDYIRGDFIVWSLCTTIHFLWSTLSVQHSKVNVL